MKKPNLNSIIQNNSDKTGHISNLGLSKLPSDSWVEKYKKGGGYFPEYDSWAPPRMEYGGDPTQPYHPITNPDGYKQNNVLEKIKKLPNKEKGYEPTNAVKNLKTTLAAASLANAGNPFTQYLTQVAGGTGDLYTAGRYAADGQWGKAGEDAVQGVLGFIPYAKATQGLKGDYFTKGARLFNQWLKRGQNASDIKTFTESPTPNYPIHAYGGDISIPDLNPDTWLLKYKGGGPGDGIGGFFRNIFGGDKGIACPSLGGCGDIGGGGGLHLGEFFGKVGHGIGDFFSHLHLPSLNFTLPHIGLPKVGLGWGKHGRVRRRRCIDAGMKWDEETRTCRPADITISTSSENGSSDGYTTSSSYTTVDTTTTVMPVEQIQPTDNRIVFNYISPEGNTQENLMNKGSLYNGVPGGVNDATASTAKYGGSRRGKYAKGGQLVPPDLCPPNYVRVNSICIPIDSDEYRKAYAKGLISIGTVDDPNYVTSDSIFAKPKQLQNVTVNGKKTKPKERSLISYVNPMNWGVEDYSNYGSFSKAYSKAKKAGEKEFMYGNTRYSTDYAGTPRQEVGAYGINGKPLHPMDLNAPTQTNLYPPFGAYLPGHISAQALIPGYPSVDYSGMGNYVGGIGPADKEEGEKSYYSYGVNSDKFYDVAAKLPEGSFNPGSKPSTWNLFTNNCADNVCDAMGVSRTPFGITLPDVAMKKIKKKYPTLDVTGRTYADYVNLMSDLESSSKPKDVLKKANYILGIASSPEFKDKGVLEGGDKVLINSIQQALWESGYELPKSKLKTRKDGRNFDGVFATETKAALEDWQSKNKKYGGDISIPSLKKNTWITKYAPGGSIYPNTLITTTTTINPQNISAKIAGESSEPEFEVNPYPLVADDETSWKEGLNEGKEWLKNWYAGRATLPQFKTIANQRKKALDKNYIGYQNMDQSESPGATAFYSPSDGNVHFQFNDPYSYSAATLSHEFNHGLWDITPQDYQKSIIKSVVIPKNKWEKTETGKSHKNNKEFGYDYFSGDSEIGSRTKTFERRYNLDPTKVYTAEEMKELIDNYRKYNKADSPSRSNTSDDEIDTLLDIIGDDPEKLKILVNKIVTTNNRPQTMGKYGGWLTKYAPGGVTTETTTPPPRLSTEQLLAIARKSAEAKAITNAQKEKERLIRAAKDLEKNPNAWRSKKPQAVNKPPVFEAPLTDEQRVQNAINQGNVSRAMTGQELFYYNQLNKYGKTKEDIANMQDWTAKNLGFIGALPIVAGAAVLPQVAAAASATGIPAAIGAGLNAPILGAAGLTGGGWGALTLGNALTSYFGAKGLTKLPSVVNDWSNVKDWNSLGDAAANTLETGLNLLPLASKALPKFIEALNTSKESGILSDVYKLNPRAGKIPMLEGKPNWLRGWSKDYSDPTKIDFSGFSKYNENIKTPALKELSKHQEAWNSLTQAERNAPGAYQNYSDKSQELLNKHFLQATGYEPLFDPKNVYSRGAYSLFTAPLKNNPNIIFKYGQEPFEGQNALLSHYGKSLSNEYTGLPFHYQQITPTTNVTLMPKVVGEGSSFGLANTPRFEIPRESVVDLAKRIRKLKQVGIYPDLIGDNMFFDPATSKISMIDFNLKPDLSTSFGKRFFESSNLSDKNIVSELKKAWNISPKPQQKYGGSTWLAKYAEGGTSEPKVTTETTTPPIISETWPITLPGLIAKGIDVVSDWFGGDDKKSNVQKPAIQKTAPLETTIHIKLNDPRKTRMTTGQKMNPNRDLTSGNYVLNEMAEAIKRGKKRGMSMDDIWNLAAIDFQETGLGNTDNQMGHAKDYEGEDYIDAFLNAYQDKMKTANRLKLKDPYARLQVYNGRGKVYPTTEQWYHGFKANSFYGVPVPKTGIDLSKNPLYGKQIVDLRDNVLKKNPDFVKFITETYNSKKMGGQINWTNKYK